MCREVPMKANPELAIPWRTKHGLWRTALPWATRLPREDAPAPAPAQHSILLGESLAENKAQQGLT